MCYARLTSDHTTCSVQLRIMNGMLQTLHLHLDVGCTLQPGLAAFAAAHACSRAEALGVCGSSAESPPMLHSADAITL